MKDRGGGSIQEVTDEMTALGVLLAAARDRLHRGPLRVVILAVFADESYRPGLRVLVVSDRHRAILPNKGSAHITGTVQCGDATRAGHAQEAGQLVIFVGAGASIGHPSDLPSFGRLTEIIRDESELNDVIDDALFWVGMRAGVVGLVAVAFSNEFGTITTLSKCSSKLAMLTGNGQRTLAVR